MKNQNPKVLEALLDLKTHFGMTSPEEKNVFLLGVDDGERDLHSVQVSYELLPAYKFGRALGRAIDEAETYRAQQVGYTLGLYK